MLFGINVLDVIFENLNADNSKELTKFDAFVGLLKVKFHITMWKILIQEFLFELQIFFIISNAHSILLVGKCSKN